MALTIYRKNESEDGCPATEKAVLGREDGNVLLISLILLVLLTMIGISATRTASVDIQVSGNNMVYKKNFYTAEAATMEAMQRMETTDLETTDLEWVLPASTTDSDISNPDKWDTAPWFGGGKKPLQSVVDSTAQLVVITEGTVETGESLDMTRTKLYQYAVYGRCKRYNGTSIINVGYRKAY